MGGKFGVVLEAPLEPEEPHLAARKVTAKAMGRVMMPPSAVEWVRAVTKISTAIQALAQTTCQT